MKHLTIEQLANHLEGKLWKQKRIYLREGYNTRKIKTATYVYQKEDGTFCVFCEVDCPSQPYSWEESQQNEIIERVTNRIDAIIEEHGVEGPAITSTPIDMVLNNAALEAVAVRGYYTEWREVRIAINRFGKLALRNRQFLVPFEGTQANAPRGFVPLSDDAYSFLVSRSKKREGYMLEPYTDVPDLESMSRRYTQQQKELADQRDKEAIELAEQQEQERQHKTEQLARLDAAVAAGMDILKAWKSAGCNHPAPIEVVKAKKESGLNWKQFINSISI